MSACLLSSSQCLLYSICHFPVMMCSQPPTVLKGKIRVSWTLNKSDACLGDQITIRLQQPDTGQDWSGLKKKCSLGNRNNELQG